jgi:hypothetical protein
MHGLLPIWQMSPTAEFPLARPLTNHVTAASEVFETVGVNVARCPVATLAAEGEMLTATLLVKVTVAEAIAEFPAGDGAVALMFTRLGDGRTEGAA